MSVKDWSATHYGYTMQIGVLNNDLQFVVLLKNKTQLNRAIFYRPMCTPTFNLIELCLYMEDDKLSIPTQEFFKYS